MTSPARRSRGALAGLGATVGLGVLILGVPAALGAVVGWPLPHGLPRGSEISEALRDPSFIPDRFWIGAAAVVAWVTWLQVAGATLVELVAALAHRPTPNVALFVAPARGLARRLVSSATLVGMLATTRPALAQPAPRPPAVVATVPSAAAPPAAADAQGSPLGAASLGATRETTAVSSQPVHVVGTWEASRACLWTIAEERLADPLRWREIWELNRGRPQADGGVLSEPDLILPGWQLVLPADAVGVSIEQAPNATPATAAAEAPRAATGSGTALQPAGTAPVPATSVVTTPAPSVTTPAPATTAAPVPTTAVTAAPAPTAEASAGGEAAQTRAPELAGRPSPAGDTVFSKAGLRALHYGAMGLPVMAAGGLVLALNRRRRAQVAACRPGRDIRRPSPDLEPLERELRAIAADEASEWVDAAMRALAGDLAGSECPRLPEIVAVRPGDLGLEVLLGSADDEPPAGWEAVDGGFVWRLERRVDLAELQRRAAGQSSTSPALVSLGASPEGPVLVDLEALGALSVEGDPARVGAFLSGVALELLCAPWAQGVDLRLVGASEAVARNDGATCLDDADALVAELAALMEATRGSLGDHPSTLAGRLDPRSGDDWAPTLVVVARSGVAPPEVLERLATLTRVPGAGAAVVAPGPLVGARWRLHIEPDGRASLEPLGLSVHVAGVAEGLEVTQAGLDEAAIDGAATLLATAADVDDVAPVTELLPDVAPTPTAPRQPAEVWVAVLGPVEVTGWATPIRQRKKFAELVAYLATHPERPVPGERLHAACWPDQETATYASFKETMSRVRNHLGDDSRGRRHLPQAVNSAYSLGPHVGCDWIRFKELVAEAGHAAPAEALRLYGEALELVRGEPFADVAKGTYVWAWSENLVYEIELTVGRVASAMGQLALDLGDPERAMWASARGQLASPVQQSLFRVDMRAAAELGDTDGITRALQAATRAQHRVDPETELPAETVDLYRHLTGRRGRADGGRAASSSSRSGSELAFVSARGSVGPQREAELSSRSDRP